ncbi:hypothetical protein EV122DRAFT_223945 [Schizophyllum commune]
MSTSSSLVSTSPPMNTSPPPMGGLPLSKDNPSHLMDTPSPTRESSSPPKHTPFPSVGVSLAPLSPPGYTTPDQHGNIDNLSNACHHAFDASPPLSPSIVSALSSAAKSRSPSPSFGGSPLAWSPSCPPPSRCGSPDHLSDPAAAIRVRQDLRHSGGSSPYDKDFAARVEEVLRRRLTVEDGWRLSDCSSSTESDREWRFSPQELDDNDEEEELTIYVARPGGTKTIEDGVTARSVSDAIMKSDSKMNDVVSDVNSTLYAPDLYSPNLSTTLDSTLPIPIPPPSIRWGPGRKSYGALGTRRGPSSQPTMRRIPSILVGGVPGAGPLPVPSAGLVFVPSADPLFVPSARPVVVPNARPDVVQGVRPHAIPIVRPDGTRLDAIARPDAVSGSRLHIPNQQAPIEEMPAMAMQPLQPADMPSPSFDSAYALPGDIPHSPGDISRSPTSPTARSPSSDASYPASPISYPASPTYSPTSPIVSTPFTPTKHRSLAQYRSVTEPLAAAVGPWSPAPYLGAQVSRARFRETVSEPLQGKLPQAGWGRERTASKRSYDHLGSDNSVALFGADHIASPPTTPGLSHDDEEDWSWALAVGQGAPAGLSADLSPNASRRTSLEEDWRAMQETSLRSSMDTTLRSSTASDGRSSMDPSAHSSTQSGRRSSTEGTAPTERNWRATQQFDWRASRTGRPVRRSWEVKDRRVSDGGARLVSDGGARLVSDGGVRLVSDIGARFVSDSGAGMSSDSAVHGRDSTKASFRRVVSDGRLDLPLGPMSLPRSPLSPTRRPLSPTRGPSSSPRAPLSSSHAPSSRTQRSFARASSTPEGILRHSDDGILHQPGTPRHKDSRRTNSARHVHFGEGSVARDDVSAASPPSGQGWRDDRATEAIDPLQNAVDMVRKAIDAVKKAVEPATMDVGHKNRAIDHDKSALDDMVYREVMRAALGDGWEAATPIASPREASDDQSSRPRSRGDEEKKGDKSDAKGSGKAPHPRSKRDRRGRPDAKGAKGSQARAPSKSPRKKSKDPSQSRDGRALDEAIRAAMQDEPLPTWQVSKDRTSNIVALQMQALAMSQAASDAKAQAASEAKAQAAARVKPQASNSAKSGAARDVKSKSASEVKPAASAAMSRSASDAGGLGTGKATFWDNARGTYVAQNAYTQLTAY